MKIKLLLFFCALFVSSKSFSQTYTMPTTGNSNATTCSGTFYDNGGTGGNYANNVSSTFTFCPATPGQLIRVVFNYYDAENLTDNLTVYDSLEIFNGPSVASPKLTTLVLDYTVPITFESSDPSGCITFRFTSDGSTREAGWEALVSCFLPCVPPTSSLVCTGFPTAPAKICPGDNLNFSGAPSTAGAGFSIVNYSWNFGDGSALATGLTTSHSFPDVGIYYVNLTVTDNNGCVNNNLIKYEIDVSPPTFFNGTSALDNQLCLGESTTITGVPTPQIFQEEPLSFIAGELYLPDGDNAGYNAQITYQEFAAGATVTNINQILDVWANLEHTYLGDLAIDIICPNGSTVSLHNADHLFDGANGQYLGNPIPTDGTGPGTGFDYSWPTSGATTTLANAAGDPRPAGAYLAEEAFTPLLGCPLNGTWTLYILDTEAQDDGYIFNWGINFDPSLYNLQTLTPVNVTTIWTADPSITNTAGNTITVQPTTTGVHTYTFTATNDYGCPYDTTISITVNPLPVANAGTSGQTCSGVNYNLGAAATAGNTYAWLPAANLSSTTIANPVYNQTIPGPASVTTTYTVTQTITATGCTDTSQVVVTVNPTPTVTVNSPTICVGTTTLTATGATNYTWSAGATSITPSGDQSTVAPAATAQFTVTGTIGTCTATAVSTVTVNNNTPAPTTAPISYCQNATAFALTATPSAGGTLNWYGTNAVGGTASATAPTPSTAVVGATTYYVSQSVGGCEGPRAPLVVTINALPTATAGSNSPVCVGAAINLTSGGGTGYSWTGPNAYTNATQNPSIGSATIAMAGNYIVTVTNANGCVATATTTVVVNPLPTPTANNDGAYCENGTINLTATGGTGFAWTGPNAFVNATQNPSITNATLAMAGNYIVTVTNANGCIATANTTVVINALPVAPTTAPISYCLNATAIPLMATATGTLNWYGTNAVGGTASSTAPTPSTATAGITTFYVSQTITGCEGPRAPLTVTINALPTPTVNNTGPYCVNATINLTSGGGTGYAWTGPNAYNVVNNQNPTIATATTAMAGNYVVTVTDANGCVATATTTVVVNPLPTPTANNTGPYCANGTISLSATGGIDYDWTGPNAYNTPNTQNPTILSATTAMSGTYNVSVTDANGCNASVTTLVTVNPLPAPIASSTGPYCVNDTIFLITTPTTFISYHWDGPLGFQSEARDTSILLITVPMGGIYTVTVIDANGCQATSQTNVIVNPLPIVSATNNGELCEGEQLLLGCTAGANYSWFGPNLFTSTNANPTINPTIKNIHQGMYSVIVTDINGCKNPAFTNVIINSIPAAPTTIPDTYCQNSTTSPVEANGTGTLNWYGTNATGGIADPNAPTPISTNPGLTTYYVSQTVSNCEGPRAPLDVTINPLPSANINTIAPDCAPICRNFFLSSTDNLTAYTWDLGNGIFTGNDTVPQHCYSDAGVYDIKVTVTDLNGCSNLINFNNWVTVYEVPIAEFSFGPDKVSVLEPEINFVDLSLGSNIVFYSWQFGDALSSTSGIANPTFAYTDIGVYNVTHIVMNDKGCRDTVIHPVTIPQDWAIYVPNAFSPNEDGVNDYFHPAGIGLDEKTYNLWIFDRWGNMIFYTKDWNTYWDGKVQGHTNVVQEDTYIWKINVKSFNGKKFYDTGHVHVIK